MCLFLPTTSRHSEVVSAHSSWHLKSKKKKINPDIEKLILFKRFAIWHEFILWERRIDSVSRCRRGFSACWFVRLSSAKEWMTSESQEHRRSVWTLGYLGQPFYKKKKQDRCGVRLKWCTEPEGLMEHIELWFSGLSRFYKEWRTVISGGFFASWMLIFLLFSSSR